MCLQNDAEEFGHSQQSKFDVHIKDITVEIFCIVTLVFGYEIMQFRYLNKVIFTHVILLNTTRTIYIFVVDIFFLLHHFHDRNNSSTVCHLDAPS